MMQRLLGFLFVVRGLTPALILLIVVWATASLFNDFRVVLVPQLEAIQTELDNLQNAYTEVEEQWGTIQTDITKLSSQFQRFRVPNLLPDLPNKLSIQLDIPDPSLPVPSGVDVRWSSVNVTFSERVRIKVDCGPFDFLCDGWNWITRETTKSVRYPSNLTVSTSNVSVQIPNVNLDLPIDSLKEPLEPLEGIFSSIQDVFDAFDEIFASLSRSKFGVFGYFQSRLQGFWSHLFRFRLQKTTYFISENRPNLTQKLDIDRQICIYVNCLARILSQNLKFGSTEPRKVEGASTGYP
ncbi:hypothetical protein KFU94_02435 [Chloroflexi bacterium TSY]|nr:hypothetical protein [Chloroflexi bacterium TSY]